MEDQNATYYLKERNIYGSSRLGMIKDTVNMFNPEALPSYGITGNRNYELSNHLGNVLAVVSDNVYPISSDNSTIDTYRVGLDQVYDYSPFGVQLDGRTIEPDPVIISDTSYIVTEEWLYASDFNVSTSDLSSYNGWFATAGTAALFVDGSTNQRLKIVSANTNSGANRYFDVINGERYVVKFDLDKGALSNVTARVYAIVGSSQTLLTSKTMTVSQTDSLVFDATSNQILVQFVQNGTLYMDNFSLLKKNYSLIQYDNLEAAVSQGSVNGWTYDASTTYAWVTGGRLNAKGGKIQKFFSSLLQGTNVTLNIDKGTNSSVIVKTFTYQQTIFGFNLVHTGTQTITTNGNYSFTCSILEIEPVGAQIYYIDNVSGPGGTETFTTPNIIAPHIQNWQVKSQNHLLKQGEHTTNNVVTNRSIILNATVEKTFAVTPSSQYEFSMDDITTYSPPTSPGGPGGGISLFITYYDYTVRVYKGNSTTAFYTTQFNLSNATRVINFATDSTTSQIRIEISRGLATTLGYTKYVDNLKLRKFTGNTSVYNTNYSNMSLTANALDGWAPDNWATTSATVDQSAGQYRLVAIGSGATAKVQREFTALPNQEHRFQYNLSLLNGGSTTVRVEQKVNGVYQYLATQQTQTSSGTYELSFVPTETDIRISVSGTSRYALQNLYLDRDQVDTLVSTYALSRGYRYGFNGKENIDEVAGQGNSYDFGARMYDSRLGRWLTIDPLAGKYPSLSPYNFVANSPLIFVDPDGRKIVAFDEYSKKQILIYLADQFVDGLFKFKKNGELKIQKSAVKLFLKNPNTSDLQLEMYNALKEVVNDSREFGVYVFEEASKVEINRNPQVFVGMEEVGEDIYGEKIYRKKYEAIYQKADGSDGWSITPEKLDGGGISVFGVEGIDPFIAIADKEASLDRLHTNNSDKSNSEEQKTIGCASCVFIHEVLDHIYSEAIKKESVNRAKTDKVKFHSKALENKGSQARSGSDHQ